MKIPKNGGGRSTPPGMTEIVGGREKRKNEWTRRRRREIFEYCGLRCGAVQMSPRM
jgi:hypothetical protein